MTTQAQYDATGQIMATISPNVITDKAQIDALAARGISLVVIPDGKSGASGSIVDGQYQDYPVVTPIPNLLVQLTAALIGNGTVDSSAFHPTTMAQVNDALTTASMTTLSASKSLGAATVTP